MSSNACVRSTTIKPKKKKKKSIKSKADALRVVPSAKSESYIVERSGKNENGI